MFELKDLATFAQALAIEAIPEKVKTAACHCLLDTVSVSCGAAKCELIENIRKTYMCFGAAKGDLRASIWGTNEKGPLLTAVFVNAMAGHFYELDDVHCESKTHIGTVVIPAAYSLAEALGSSGEELVTAIVVGYEVTARIGMAFGVTGHRKLGWHSTSTAGIFGAAAACGRLIHLSVDEMENALGLAGTQAFGRWAFLEEGATCKILHPARAATSGCESAFLASAGMTGPKNILMAKDGGLIEVMAKEPALNCLSEELGKNWAILSMDNKPYPCCRSTHSSIDAALALKREHLLSADKIQTIDIETYEVGKLQCASSQGSLTPKTPMEAKFSTPYAVACALLRDGVGLKDFMPDAVMNNKIQILLQKVNVCANEMFSRAYPQHWGCQMKITCTDGNFYEISITDASGSKDVPLTEAQLLAKSEQMLALLPNVMCKKLQRSLLEICGSVRVPALAEFWEDLEE